MVNRQAQKTWKPGLRPERDPEAQSHHTSASPITKRYTPPEQLASTHAWHIPLPHPPPYTTMLLFCLYLISYPLYLISYLPLYLLSPNKLSTPLCATVIFPSVLYHQCPSHHILLCMHYQHSEYFLLIMMQLKLVLLLLSHKEESSFIKFMILQAKLPITQGRECSV